MNEEDIALTEVEKGHLRSLSNSSLLVQLRQPFDWADVLKADVRVNQYAYEMDDGSSGVSAYCDSLFVTIAEDNLENKYFDVPDQTPGGYLAADDYDEDDD